MQMLTCQCFLSILETTNKIDRPAICEMELLIKYKLLSRKLTNKKSSPIILGDVIQIMSRISHISLISCIHILYIHIFDLNQTFWLKYPSSFQPLGLTNPVKSPNPAGAKKGISGTLVVKVVKVKQISYGGDETSRSPPKKKCFCLSMMSWGAKWIIWKQITSCQKWLL